MLCRTSPETKRNEIKTYITDVAKVKWPKNFEEPRLQDGVYVCRIRNNGADITVMTKLEELYVHPYICPLERGSRNSKNASFAFDVISP